MMRGLYKARKRRVSGVAAEAGQIKAEASKSSGLPRGLWSSADGERAGQKGRVEYLMLHVTFLFMDNLSFSTFVFVFLLDISSASMP